MVIFRWSLLVLNCHFAPDRNNEEKGERLHDHLLTTEQRVANELASPQSNGSVGHFGGWW